MTQIINNKHNNKILT